MNYLSTRKYKTLESEIGSITSISADDKTRVYEIIKRVLNYDESRGEYHKHYYKIQKAKMDEDDEKREAYLARQRQKTQAWLSNEENVERKRAYNKARYERLREAKSKSKNEVCG